MIPKKLNSSKTKMVTVAVECRMKGAEETKNSIETKFYDIDSDVFDDVFLEASTRFADERIRQKNAKLPAILYAYPKDDPKNINKHFGFNSYFMIINAGHHKKAEIMRKNFLTISGIDLKNESIKS